MTKNLTVLEMYEKTPTAGCMAEDADLSKLWKRVESVD